MSQSPTKTNAARNLRDHITRRSLFIPLAALALLTVLLVPPRGDFPLNDGWIYAQTVQGILDTGAYTPSPFADPSYIVHAYWGAAFCLVLGFSFVTLQISTLVMWLLGGWAAALCGQAVGLKRANALLMGVLFLANPLALNLSYTFMTDVPFLTLSAFSALFFLKALSNPATKWVALASIVSVAAFFVRQFGVLVPIAYGGTVALLLVRKKTSVKWGMAAALALPWIAVGLVLRFVPNTGGGVGVTWDWSEWGDSLGEKVFTVTDHLLVGLVYLSLFMLPVLAAALCAFPWKQTRWRSRKTVVIATLALYAAYLVLREPPRRIPLLGNLLYDTGVGPMLLQGSIVDGELAAAVRLPWLWWGLTFAGVAGAATFLLAVVPTVFRTLRRTQSASRKATDPHAAHDLFLLLWGAAMLSVLILPAIAVRFDRYFLGMLIPWGLLLLKLPWLEASRAAVRQKGARRVALGATALLYAFSIVSLQDYLAWNAARWEATDQIQAEHNVGPEEIDGGYEFNGWHNSARFVVDGQRSFGPKGGWIVEDNYAVSLQPRKRFEQIGAVEYFSWLGLSKRQILMLRRTEPDPFL